MSDTPKKPDVHPDAAYNAARFADIMKPNHSGPGKSAEAEARDRAKAARDERTKRKGKR